jgi:phage terminase large subunit
MTGRVQRIVLPFAPRPWQEPLLDDPSPRIVAVVHRRAGKSDVLMWRGLRKALTHPRYDPAPRVIHTLPLMVQWERTGLWDRLCRAAAGIPGSTIRKQERRIILPNGGVYQVGGMDNPDGWRGGYADEFIEDEADDIAGQSLETVIEPMLSDHAGTRIWAGTPKGNGRLKDRYERARHEPGYSAYLLRYDQTGFLGAIDRAARPDAWEAGISRLRTEMTQEEFAQEMECSFEAPNSGSYYGRLIAEAERDGRIGDWQHDPRFPVITAWDLGVDDATAIWFVQPVPGGFHVIDYLEDSGAGADHYARLLKAKPYTYARHHLPHDVEQREWGNEARSRRAVLENLGVRPIVTGKQAPVADGINAVRMILPRCKFNARACEAGLKALRSYRREWNDASGTWRATPFHGWESHGADAFREFAVNAAEWREAARKPAASARVSTYNELDW